MAKPETQPDRRTARVSTPISKDDPDQVTAEDIPLPPEGMWQELENTPAETPVPAEPKAGVAPVRPAAPKVAPREIAELDFLEPIGMPVPLAHPFRWDGRKITEIVVRPLTVGEIGDAIDELPDDRPDNFDLYARMTGLPARVLRGLVNTDGERVAEACYDFLPRAFRGAPDEAAASSSS